MKIYTKTGDHGETALYGGSRVSKAHLRVAAYGAVDELNAQLGVAAVYLEIPDLRQLVLQLQATLFELGADLATPQEVRAALPRVSPDDVAALEAAIDRLDAALPPLRNFILPGGAAAAAQLQLARAVARRAEREVVALGGTEAVNPQVQIYLNRLSDLLFVLARTVNARAQVPEAIWNPRPR